MILRAVRHEVARQMRCAPPQRRIEVSGANLEATAVTLHRYRHTLMQDALARRAEAQWEAEFWRHQPILGGPNIGDEAMLAAQTDVVVLDEIPSVTAARHRSAVDR